MLEKVIQYFDKEYCNLKEWFQNPNVSLSNKMKRLAVDRAIAHCLGVTMFIQECGISYDEITTHFQEVKIKLMNLIESEE